MTTITLRIDARQYEDYDDCLTAAAADVAEERGLEGYDLSPRWEDDERDTILVDVPAYYTVEFTADVEGNWCQSTWGKKYPTREAAQAAIDADPTAQPDDFGNRCYPTIVEH